MGASLVLDSLGNKFFNFDFLFKNFFYFFYFRNKKNKSFNLKKFNLSDINFYSLDFFFPDFLLNKKVVFFNTNFFNYNKRFLVFENGFLSLDSNKYSDFWT